MIVNFSFYIMDVIVHILDSDDRTLWILDIVQSLGDEIA